MQLLEPDSRRELGHALKSLRTRRGLSLSEIAERSGVARAAIGSWEAGTRAPSGVALDAALGALNAELGLRSRLLALAAPRYAQQALSSTPLGPPVHAGQILRAIRLRQGFPQSQLALTLGVTQGHLARWESGDLLVPRDQWDRLCQILGASEQEVRALRSVVLSAESPRRRVIEEEVERVCDFSYALQPIVLLGMEAELWRQATEDDAWRETLCRVVSLRANAALMNGNLREVAELARRTYNMAKASGAWRVATHAFYANRWRNRYTRLDWESEAASLEEWIPRLPDSEERAWMLNCLGLAHAHLGEQEKALTMTHRSLEMVARHGVNVDHCRAIDLGEVWLALGSPERALDELGGFDRPRSHHLRAMIHLKMGESVPDSVLEATRQHLDHGPWLHRHKFAELERAAARRR